jgi:hypothetical protein
MLYIASFGQSDSSEINRKQFHGYFGIQVPDIGDLNSNLGANNYPQFKENIFSVGLGMVQMTKKKVVFQQELNVYSQTKSNDSVSSSLRSISFGQSLFGYSYVQNERFQMYSLLGITYFNSTVKVSKEISSGTSFNGYSSGIGNQVEMTTNNFVLNVSTHFNYSIKLPKTNNCLILGIRAVYYIPFENSKWMTGKTELSNAPSFNPGGYAVNFVLGFSY